MNISQNKRARSPIRIVRGMSDDDDIYQRINQFKTKFMSTGEFSIPEYIYLLKKSESFMMSDFTKNPALPKLNPKCDEYQEFLNFCLSKKENVYKRFFYEC